MLPKINVTNWRSDVDFLCVIGYNTIGGEEMLKNLRLEKHLTQQQTARILGISRRSLVRYEQNEAVLPEKKLRFFCQLLNEYGLIDEEHGVLSLEQIKQICAVVFAEYGVEYCYLFGSYAKGKATEKATWTYCYQRLKKACGFMRSPNF